MLQAACSNCPAQGLGQDDSGDGFWSQFGEQLAKTIPTWSAAGAQILAQKAIQPGTYIQTPQGGVTYVQPAGSTTPIFAATSTLVGGKITAGSAAPFGDTSTVLIIGLGIVGVFMLVSLMKGRR